MTGDEEIIYTEAGGREKEATQEKSEGNLVYILAILAIILSIIALSLAYMGL